jgi:hypothetical protein
MPRGYPPTAFVSSTCYDLSHIRADLKNFLSSLGFEPLLSEISSFPINPQSTTVENCVNAVKERADIFILILGARYGTQNASGKSITNLEYLAAKAKGIPIYVFALKPIIEALPSWKSNKGGNFEGIVDSPQLFEFVEQLYGSQEHWVFPFENALEITETLRRQLGYLFTDSLLYREKFLQSHLPECLQSLSGACLKYVMEKPLGWEYYLFANVLSEEIAQLRHLKWDLSYSIAIGKTNQLGNAPEVMNWLAKKMHEMTLLGTSFEKLLNVAMQEALGPEGAPGNPEHIVYVARRVSGLYKAALQWAIEFNHVDVDPEFQRALHLASELTNSFILEIESMPQKFVAETDKGVTARQRGEAYTPNLRFTLNAPDNSALLQEIERLRRQFT